MGVALEMWHLKLKAGEEISFPVHVLNDSYESVDGQLLLSLIHKEDKVLISSENYKLEGLEREVFQAGLLVPALPGRYILEASLDYKGESIRSTREFLVE